MEVLGEKEKLRRAGAGSAEKKTRRNFDNPVFR